MGVLALFVWGGICALVSWLTAFRMPDGYGNAIVLLQFFAALASIPFVVVGVLNLPRTQGIRYTAIGVAIYIAATIGGWQLDRAIGLPARHAVKIERPASRWFEDQRATLDACLATVWSKDYETCHVTLRAAVADGAPRVAVHAARCASPPIESCLTRAITGGPLALDPRSADSLAFAGHLDVEVLTFLKGTGAPPPVERAP